MTSVLDLKTDSFPDLTIPAIINNGSQPLSDSGCGTDDTYNLDGVGYLSSSLRPFSVQFEAENSFALWVTFDGNNSGTNRAIMAQLKGGNNQTFLLQVTTNDELYATFRSGIGTARIDASIASGINNWDDGNRHYISVAGSRLLGVTLMRIFIDGVEASAYILKDFPSGNYVGTKATSIVDSLSFGALEDGANAGQYKPEWASFWEGTRLTAAQHAEAYQLALGCGVLPPPSNGVTLEQANRAAYYWNSSPRVI